MAENILMVVNVGLFVVVADLSVLLLSAVSSQLRYNKRLEASRSHLDELRERLAIEDLGRKITESYVKSSAKEIPAPETKTGPAARNLDL